MNPKRPETWLFDLGNSRAKAARLEHAEPVAVNAFDWDRPDFAAVLRDHLAGWPHPERVLVASVASEARAQRVRRVLAGFTPGRVEWLRTPRHACGVVNRYAKPERLGIDRFLAMLAAHASAPGACVVIGCGTAMTLDCVAADGEHVEGMITLSPAGMLQTLQGGTAIADRNPDAFAEAPADDTAAALQAGCWASAGALVEWFVASCRERHAASRTEVHGGWAGRLAEWLAREGCLVEVQEHLVLRGLAVWADELCDDP